MEDSEYYNLVYVSYFFAALIFSLLINGLFLKFASSLGIRNRAETVIRWGQAKPALGGISFFIIFLLSVASYSIFFPQTTILLNRQLLGLITACTMAFLMGLADDAYNTRPLLKLSVQLICGIMLVQTGTCAEIFPSHTLNVLFTIIWTAGVMNAINMLDNMDAIGTVVSICIIATAVMFQYLHHDFYSVYMFLLIGLLASLGGFLFFNWHPSKLYMGDTGSQFLGVVLAAVGIYCFMNKPDLHDNAVQSKQVITAILVYIIPIIDGGCVVINRMAKGRSPFVGGKDHTTHHLFYYGVTEKRIAVLFGAIALISFVLILIINYYITDWSWFHITLFSLYFLLLFSVMLLFMLKKRSA